MSENTKASPPAAAPAAAPREVAPPLLSYVKGGTVSLAYENQIKQKRAESEDRRAIERSRHETVKADPRGAKMMTADLGSQQKHAAIVLEIRNSDNRAEEFIRCELTVGQHENELILVMCCPRCAVKYGTDEAQMHITTRNKKFELDQRRSGELWVNPRDPREMCTIAGTIHMHEIARCPGAGCTWAFRIDDSVIKPV